MNPNDLPCGAAIDAHADDLLSPLLQSPKGQSFEAPGVVVGELLALADDMPLVVYPGQPGTQALSARSTVDLHGPHIGKQVVLAFEHGDPLRPIVVGVLCGQPGWPVEQQSSPVAVDADGLRMIVGAKDQLVIRCGKASITLTKAGKVLIEGAYLLSRSTGVNRIKGGSVQLN
jgi:hypothetical protein